MQIFNGCIFEMLKRLWFLPIAMLFSCHIEDDSNLVHAAAICNIDAIKSLVPKVSSIDAKANDGWTALTMAAFMGCASAVTYLLDNGSDINIPEGGAIHLCIGRHSLVMSI